MSEFKNIYDAHLALKNKKISAKELCVEHIKVAKENKNNTFITLTEDFALEKAKKIDEKGINNHLDGIPFSLKDLFITKNIRTTAGSKMLYNYIPPYEGTTSDNLQDAGAVLIGKVGCDEFGMGSSNENTPFGPVNLPINNDYLPGGSSGASAVSVLEGSSLFSMGTDTGGSVRLPANFCGLVGYKPTYGRVSRYGQIAYASSLDQASPFAKTPLDIAMIMDSITKNDEKDSTQAPIGAMNSASKILNNTDKDLKMTIGIDRSMIEGCREDVRDSLNQSIKELEKKGVKFKDISLPHLKYSVAVYYVIATSEASSNLARFDGVHFGYSSKNGKDLEDSYALSRSIGFHEEVKRRVLLGTFCLSSGYSDEYYSHACKVRKLIYDDFQKAFKECDYVYSPVCATTAFRKDEILTPLQMYMNDLYTIPVNLAGLPSMAIPYGKSSLNSLPTGFQLIGNSFKDEELILDGHKVFEVLK